MKKVYFKPEVRLANTLNTFILAGSEGRAQEEHWGTNDPENPNRDYEGGGTSGTGGATDFDQGSKIRGFYEGF